MTDWIPPVTAVPHIVCAAQKYSNIIIPSPRHMDNTAHLLIKLVLGPNGARAMEQGFIDQWGRWYSREHAWDVVQWNGQPFNQERNGPSGTLYSEGLY